MKYIVQSFDTGSNFQAATGYSARGKLRLFHSVASWSSWINASLALTSVNSSVKRRSTSCIAVSFTAHRRLRCVSLTTAAKCFHNQLWIRLSFAAYAFSFYANGDKLTILKSTFITILSSIFKHSAMLILIALYMIFTPHAACRYRCGTWWGLSVCWV